MNVVRAYVEKFHVLRRDGIGMMLIGPYGCGKTWLLKQTANSMGRWTAYPTTPNPYHNKVVMYQAGTLLATIKEAFDWEHGDRDSLHSDLINSDLLIVDDLGTEYQTTWAMTELGRLLDERYSRGNPVIISVNKLNSLEAHQTRIIDRIRETCVPVNMENCPNMRDVLMQEKRRRFADVTGLPV